MRIPERIAYKLIDMQLASSGNKRPEQKEQTAIIAKLEKHDFKVIKIVVANKSGEPDIIAVDTEGLVWLIEVKPDSGGKLAPLQRAKLLSWWQQNAIVMTAYGYADFKFKFEALLARNY